MIALTATAVGITAARFLDPIAYLLVVATVKLRGSGFYVAKLLTLCFALTAIELALLMPWWKEAGLMQESNRLAIEMFCSFVLVGIVTISLLFIYELAKKVVFLHRRP
jgi:hypothetical protein